MCSLMGCNAVDDDSHSDSDYDYDWDLRDGREIESIGWPQEVRGRYWDLSGDISLRLILPKEMGFEGTVPRLRVRA